MKPGPSEMNRLAPTREQTIGPFYPWVWMEGERTDLTLRNPNLVFRAEGQAIILRGRFFDKNGRRVTLMILEFWQANANGVYLTPQTESDPRIDPHFDGFTRIAAPGGQFAMRTIFPGASRGGDGRLRAPNITVTIFCDGIDRLVTQIFFEDRPENEADVVLASLPEALRPRLIAKKQVRAEEGMPVYEIDIHLRGEEETPFFDDLPYRGEPR